MQFRGRYWFLSNLYPCRVEVEGLVFDNAEAAFQALKCADERDRQAFCGLGGVEAKHLGRRVKMRSDWNVARIDAMRRVLASKFSNPNLARRLCAVQGEIVEENTWGDTFWGRCRGRGENMLGRLLTERRELLRS